MIHPDSSRLQSSFELVFRNAVKGMASTKSKSWRDSTRGQRSPSLKIIISLRKLVTMPFLKSYLNNISNRRFASCLGCGSLATVTCNTVTKWQRATLTFGSGFRDIPIVVLVGCFHWAVRFGLFWTQINLNGSLGTCQMYLQALGTEETTSLNCKFFDRWQLQWLPPKNG